MSRLLTFLNNISVGGYAMQSKLPDVNSALVRHRSNALEALKHNDMRTSVISLDAMNSLLPDDYQITINTNKYNELIADRLIAICTNCNAELSGTAIKVFNYYLPFETQTLLMQKYAKAWICPECNKVSIMRNTKFKKQVLEEPYYLKVVPEAPSDRFSNRLQFHEKFTKWFNTVLRELEHQISLYRAEYQAQQDGMEQPDFDEDDA